ncbi:ABC transporter ATP-binding protein [Diplocloster hominis]|uniref:ABC transporter ATP-binding protein n=1 Tax=Diplocloster hominis TaxID=3079010 RepID=UPI0031BB309B
MEEILKISKLSVEYRSGDTVAKAVNGLNMTLYKGQAMGLVGESGAGKTTTALSVMGLLPDKIGYVTHGDIEYKGQSLLKMKEKELNTIRGGKISMVFANPLSSLNPVFTVGHQITMVLRQHRHMTEKEAHAQAAKFLQMVGIPEYRMDDYPHQFSGGMRQRVGIAAALVCSPEILIADEPTTALDVTIQAQILELMKDLQKTMDSSLLMITHNLGIIAELCQTVAIMYGGEIVEYGSVREVFEHPMHWYTIGLLNAVPKLTGKRERLASIPGNVANAQMLPGGCKFHPRCKQCSKVCETKQPEMICVNENHYVQCWEHGGNL